MANVRFRPSIAVFIISFLFFLNYASNEKEEYNKDRLFPEIEKKENKIQQNCEEQNKKKSLFDIDETKKSLFDVDETKKSLFDVDENKKSLFDIDETKKSLFDVDDPKLSFLDITTNKNEKYQNQNQNAPIKKKSLFDIDENQKSLFDVDPKISFLDITTNKFEKYQNQNQNAPIIKKITTSIIFTHFIFEFLTWEEIFKFKKVCKHFDENLLKPDRFGMVTFYKNIKLESHETFTSLPYEDLKYFSNFPYHGIHNLFDFMEPFKIRLGGKYALVLKQNGAIFPFFSSTHDRHYSNMIYRNIQKQLGVLNERKSTEFSIKTISSHDYHTLELYDGKIIQVINFKNVKYFCSSSFEIEGDEKIKWVESTRFAFAALLDNNKVKTWGCECINEMNCVYKPLKCEEISNVLMIYSNCYAFAAILFNRKVIAWGDKDNGGEIPFDIQEKLKNVKSIFKTDRAFAALLNNGDVYSWGDKYYGGLQEIEIHNVETIVSTHSAFLALLKNHDIVMWGHCDMTIPTAVINKVKCNVKKIFATEFCFAVFLKNGKLYVWGSINEKGVSWAEITQNIKMICGTYDGIIFLSTNGVVMTSSLDSLPPFAIKTAKMIVSTQYACVALLESGSVVSWGRFMRGIPHYLKNILKNNVKMLFVTEYDFIALLKDDTVVRWWMEDERIEIPDVLKNKKVLTVLSFTKNVVVICKDGTQIFW